MAHVVLLGDSILDNAVYTAGGPAVIDHLQARLPAGWQASLLALDGSITSNVLTQLEHLPAKTTHLIVSAGGNDALAQSGVISESVTSVAQALQRLTSIQQHFSHAYQQMLHAILRRQLPTVLCTIYYPNFADPLLQQITSAGLFFFNDVILSAAIRAGLPVLDLRSVCTQSTDYANEIEPSVTGGAKIAEAIVRAVTQHDFSHQRTAVYV
jgi:hypothetical protein